MKSFVLIKNAVIRKSLEITRDSLLLIFTLLSTIPLVVFLLYHLFGISCVGECFSTLWKLSACFPVLFVAIYFGLWCVAFWWMATANFKKLRSCYFWPILIVFYSFFCFLFMFYVDVSLNGDSQIFQRTLEGMMKNDVKFWIRAAYVRWGVFHRFLFSFAPFYRLFGTSSTVTMIINFVANFMIAVSLYGFIKWVFCNRFYARITAVVYLLSPIAFFLAPSPLTCTVALAYLMAGFTLLVYVVKRDEARFRLKNFGLKSKKNIFYELSVVGFGIVSGILLFAGSETRSLPLFVNLVLIIAIVSYLIWILLKYRISKWAMLHLLNVLVISAVIYGTFGALTLIGRQFIWERDLSLSGRPEFGFAWAKKNVWDSAGGREIAYPLETKMLPGEYKRMTLNDMLYILNYEDINWGGKYDSRFRYRIGQLSNTYVSYKGYLLPGKDEVKFDILYNNIFNAIRLVYIVIVSLLVVPGSIWLFRHHSIRSFITMPLWFGAILLFFFLTLGECASRYAILFMPGSAMMAAAGIMLCIKTGEPKPPVGSEKLIRKYGLALIVLMVLVVFVFGQKTLRVIHSYTWSPMAIEEASFTPESIKASDSLRAKRINANAMLIPADCTEGKMSWSVSGLQPAASYRVIIFLKSTDIDARSPYSLSVSANGQTIADIIPAESLFAKDRTHEKYEKAGSLKQFNYIYENIQSNEFGTIDFVLEVKKKTEISVPLWIGVFDCELRKIKVK